MSQDQDPKTKHHELLTGAVLKMHSKKSLAIAKKANKLAQQHNRIAERQYQQSVLNYEQSERQYLIEKSRMQPTFRLVVTEFLMCEPDFMNDPEQASEAKYLADLGVNVDERVLRIKVQVKGDAQYMRPSIIVQKIAGHGGDEHTRDERAYAMTDLIYFVQVDDFKLTESQQQSTLYLVYQDKTTLPVIHQYSLKQQLDSALRRWDAVHIDTVYVASRRGQLNLHSSSGCAEFFA